MKRLEKVDRNVNPWGTAVEKWKKNANLKHVKSNL